MFGIEEGTVSADIGGVKRVAVACVMLLMLTGCVNEEGTLESASSQSAATQEPVKRAAKKTSPPVKKKPLKNAPTSKVKPIPVSSSPMTTVEQYLTAFKNRDGSKACSLMTTSARAALVRELTDQRVGSVGTTCAEFVVILSKQAMKMGIDQTHSLKAGVRRGDYAEVEILYTGAQHFVVYGVERVKNRWYISDVSADR